MSSGATSKTWKPGLDRPCGRSHVVSQQVEHHRLQVQQQNLSRIGSRGTPREETLQVLLETLLKEVPHRVPT